MNVRSELERYGVNHKNIRDLSAPTPDVLDYLDLINAKGDEELRPDGVIESSNRPILYYVNATHLAEAPDSDADGLRVLSRNVACRGERAYLAIVKPGLLEVTPVSLEDKEPSWQVFEADSPESINFFTNLVHANVSDDDLGDPNLVFDEMLNLLETGADRIRSRIGKVNTLSLIGRALFFRFLCDREIVTDDDVPNICQTANTIKECFDNAENAYHTSRWLDETFNGDFLPFNDHPTRDFFKGLNCSTVVFQNLSAIIRGDSPVGSDGYQRQFDWATFDFAHVPVGLLSQVYEAFSWKWEKEESGATSVHYTPRNIAKTIVDEVFDGLENAHEARILDPACGAGVFLVLAFRRLYREHWRASGKRPDTKLIRKILEKQLCGFDISDSALRLSALSLYLTAIELDPKPVPPEKLRFSYLDDVTLFNHRKDNDPESGPVIGSLGEHVERSFDGTFDLVISNPPWTRIRDENKLAIQMNDVSKRVISTYDEEAATQYQNPDSVPDLPFLWRSTEWCKPSGRIAMALPSRTLFKDGKISTLARETIFRFIKFTGIVNCSNVRKTNVWPEMDQPFMIAFASNVQPDRDDDFWFICPQADFSANNIGELRIDPDASYVLPIQRVVDNSWLLKTLAIGTSLDEAIISKISAVDTKPLLRYWRRDLGLRCIKGYNVTKNPDKDASPLHELLDLGSPIDEESRFTVNPSSYSRFDRPLLERTRLAKEGGDPLAVYRAPLFLLRKSLPVERNNGNSLTSYVDIAFNQSYYGYSAKGHANSVLLVRYLNVFAHSQVWTYYVLCTSPSLGTERPVFLKSDFDSCPIVPIEKLTPETIEYIESLAIRLESDDDSAFKEIDEVIAGLYGLDKRDVEVISDTLEVRNPHDELGKRGSASVSQSEEGRFLKRLGKLLKPFARRIGVELSVNAIGFNESSSYRFLEIKDSTVNSVVDDSVDASTLELATKTGASRIIHHEAGQVVVGILNQYRYWTPSRARLLAADVLREYFSAFEAVQ